MHTVRYMTSTRRTDHDRVRQQADDSDPRWPLRGDLAYDTATSRTGVVIDVPGDTGTTVCRLCPEGGGERGWTASLDTLMPTEDAPAPLPHRTPGSTVQNLPKYAPWDAPFGTPDPSSSLRVRAERGMERFLRSTSPDGAA
ncbi:hypothetical protein Snoj_26130 [Streptomyces nojiriensis]|uniref:Uncharacterized protein n=2 Tax=Streptomyces nojiriensis TaxID=66374 RepID=A0ABQ3SKN0_9ACTN|nr:hypothetical protein JYK04_08155 [Streptomyces nojiriensis]GHI68695.1 hypothetical protein Snoj_26130 [Streptomyces nojiriensis]